MMNNFTNQKREYFVSREHELIRLRTILQDVLNGKPRIVIVPGLSGQGKSTLVRHFLSEAQKEIPEKLLIAYGICSNPTSPYHVWYDALAYALNTEDYAEEVDEFSGSKSEIIFGILKKFAPELLGNIVSNLTGGWSDTAVLTYKNWKDLQNALKTGQVRRGLIKEEERSNENSSIQNDVLIRTQFERLAKVGLIPLIFLDDLQLADNSSLYLMLEFAKKISENDIDNWPFLLILAYRSNEVRMRRKGSVYHEFRSIEKELCTTKYSNIVIPLFGIRKSLPDNPPGISIQEYINKRFIRHQFSEDFLKSVSDWTRGEAQFVHELFNLWQLNGKIRRNTSDRSWFLDGNVDLKAYTSKDIVIVQRIELLTQKEKEVLTRASVDAFSDDIFIQQIIARTFQKNYQDISAEIRALRDEHRLIELATEVIKQSSVQIYDTYRFSHSLISQVAYERLLEEDTRRRLHLAIAEEIKILFHNSDGMLSEIAFHFLAGGKYISAAVYYLRLLDLRIKQRQFHEAEVVHSMLLDMRDKSLPPEINLEVNFAIILSTGMMTRIDNEQIASEYFDKLISILETPGIQTAAIRARFYEQFDKHLYYLGKADRGILLKSIEEYMKADEPDNCINLMAATAELARRWALYQPTNELFGRLEIWLREKGYWQIYASDFLIAKSKIVAIEKGGRAEAKRLRQQALTLARLTGDKKQIYDALGSLSIALRHLGEVEESIQLAEESLAVAKDAQRIDWELEALFRCLTSHRIMGHETEWRQYTENRIQLAEEIGSLGVLSSAINNFGYGLSFFGYKKQALEAYNRKLEIDHQLGREEDTIARNNRAAIMAYVGQFNDAREEYLELMKIGREIRNYGRLTLSLVWLGKLDYRQYRLTESEKYFFEALKFSKGELEVLGFDEPSPYRNRTRVFLILRELALMYLRIGNCKRALDMVEEIEKIQKDDPNPNVNAQNLYLAVKGYVLGKCGELDKSNRILNEAMDKLSNQGRDDKLSETQLFIAEILENDDSEKSLEYAGQSLSYAEKTEAYWCADLYYLMSRLIHKNGDHEEALSYLRKAHQHYTNMEIIPMIEDTKTQINIWDPEHR